MVVLTPDEDFGLGEVREALVRGSRAIYLALDQSSTREFSCVLADEDRSVLLTYPVEALDGTNTHGTARWDVDALFEAAYPR